MVYPALLPLIRTPLVPVLEWTDAPADLNGLGRFAERRNLVSAHVLSFQTQSTTLRPFVLLVRATCRWKRVWSTGGIKLTRETRNTGRNIRPSATPSTTNLTCIDLGSSPGLRGERTPINCVGRGTAYRLALTWIILHDSARTEL